MDKSRARVSVRGNTTKRRPSHRAHGPKRGRKCECEEYNAEPSGHRGKTAHPIRPPPSPTTKAFAADAASRQRMMMMRAAVSGRPAASILGVCVKRKAYTYIHSLGIVAVIYLRIYDGVCVLARESGECLLAYKWRQARAKNAWARGFD